MSTLLDFWSDFDSAYYNGTGKSLNVPFTYPIAINGRAYMLDMKSNEFTRQYDARLRDTSDQSGEPGEAAINTQGLWRRSQGSWDLGAGQPYADKTHSVAFRFNTSKGINPWTVGELTLLKDVAQVLADSASTLKCVVAGNCLYVGTGTDVKYTTDLSSFTNCTSEPGGNVLSMTTDGYTVYVAFASNGIWKTNTSTGAFSNHISGTDSFTTVKYTKGRLMASKLGSMYNWITDGAPGAALFVHGNSDFLWVGFAGGQNAIYAAGYSGKTSLVYRTTIKADGTALDAPIVAAELPNGEVITSIDSYLGFVLIGTTTGFRFASADVNGNLEVGPLTEVGQVDAFASHGSFVWFSYKNFDSTSTGLGRMDISEQITNNQPAYASDLMVTAQGAIPSIDVFGTRPVFVVTGTGVYVEHATDLVASGYLESGDFRWGVPDVKFIPKWDLRTGRLRGTVTVAVKSDGGDYADIGTQSAEDSLASTMGGFETRIYEAEVKLTLTRSGTDNTLGPTVKRWMARAYVAALRSQVFSVPLLLHSRLTTNQGTEVYVDVPNELFQLRDLVETARVVTYQENTETYSVIVEDVQWHPLDKSPAKGQWSHDGTCVIIMRSVR